MGNQSSQTLHNVAVPLSVPQNTVIWTRLLTPLLCPVSLGLKHLQTRSTGLVKCATSQPQDCQLEEAAWGSLRLSMVKVWVWLKLHDPEVTKKVENYAIVEKHKKLTWTESYASKKQVAVDVSLCHTETVLDFCYSNPRKNRYQFPEVIFTSVPFNWNTHNSYFWKQVICMYLVPY